jgi:RNA polymerase-associated protein LEO1
MSIDSKPFHPDTYIGPDQEDEETGEPAPKERSMTVKLRVENTMRWRWAKDEDGADVRPPSTYNYNWNNASLP